jgi:hypothetical protein
MGNEVSQNDIDMCALARDAYTDKQSERIAGDQFSLKERISNPLSLGAMRADIVQNTNTGQITIAFKGSDTLANWLTINPHIAALGKLDASSERFVNDVYEKVKKDYPNATITATGHSYGGALAAFLSLTKGVNSVTIDKPGLGSYQSSFGKDNFDKIRAIKSQGSFIEGSQIFYKDHSDKNAININVGGPKTLQNSNSQGVTAAILRGISAPIANHDKSNIHDTLRVQHGIAQVINSHSAINNSISLSFIHQRLNSYNTYNDRHSITNQSSIFSNNMLQDRYSLKSCRYDNALYSYSKSLYSNTNSSVSSGYQFSQGHRGLAVQRALREQMHRSSPSMLAAYFSACAELGSPSNFSLADFRSLVQATNLTSSFNSYHAVSSISTLSELMQEIGGVATDVGVIEGYDNSIAHVFLDEAIFCMKTPDQMLPFSDAELKQLLRELATGILVHETYPFFSLHFNEDGCLYPVVHPVYQNTLVGEVISLLDYFMKGFLNGGYYKKEFLETWHKNPTMDKEYLKRNLVDLKKECKDQGINYTSLRELMSKEGLETDNNASANSNSSYKTKFRTSFRIISKQASIMQHDNMFLIDPDFDIKYSIDLMPDYQEYLEQYRQQHGKEPEDYVKIKQLYQTVANDIKEKMPKIKYFKNYFQMLGVIGFFSYYFTTLKQMGKAPDFDKVAIARPYSMPKVLPPIPVRYYVPVEIKITLGDVVEKLKEEMDYYLKNAIETRSFKIPQAFSKQLNVLFTNLVKMKIGSNDPTFELEQDYYANLERNFRTNCNFLIHLVKQYFHIRTSVNDNLTWYMNYTDIEYKNKIVIEIFGPKLEVVNCSYLETFKEEVEIIKANLQQRKQATLASLKIKNENLKFIKTRDELINGLRGKIKVLAENDIEYYKNQILVDSQEQIENYFNEKNILINKFVEQTMKLTQNFSEIGKFFENFKEIKEFEEFNKLKSFSEIDLVHGKYQNSVLDIADSTYYKVAGDNFKIVGGCGLTMSKMKTLRIPMGAELNIKLSAEIASVATETFVVKEIRGVHYAVFKLNIKDKPATDLTQFSEFLNGFDRKTKCDIEVQDLECLHSIHSSTNDKLAIEKNTKLDAQNHWLQSEILRHKHLQMQKEKSESNLSTDPKAFAAPQGKSIVERSPSQIEISALPCQILHADEITTARIEKPTPKLPEVNLSKLLTNQYAIEKWKKKPFSKDDSAKDTALNGKYK